MSAAVDLSRGDAIERAAVISEALSWIGTAYHPDARVKAIRDGDGRIVDRGGVDCAEILVAIYHAALPDRVPDLTIPHHPVDWFMHQPAAEQEVFIAWVSRFAREVDDPKPGDLVLYKWGRAYAHGAVIVEPGWPQVVHACSQTREVVCASGEFGRLMTKPRKFFSLW